jgi:hypothetical protein
VCESCAIDLSLPKKNIWSRRALPEISRGCTSAEAEILKSERPSFYYYQGRCRESTFENHCLSATRHCTRLISASAMLADATSSAQRRFRDERAGVDQSGCIRRRPNSLNDNADDEGGYRFHVNSDWTWVSRS